MSRWLGILAGFAVGWLWSRRRPWKRSSVMEVVGFDPDFDRWFSAMMKREGSEDERVS